MKAITTFLTGALSCGLLLSVGFAKGKDSDGSVIVNGYTRKDGTTVAPSHRTAPNNTKNDN